MSEKELELLMKAIEEWLKLAEIKKAATDGAHRADPAHAD